MEEEDLTPRGLGWGHVHPSCAAAASQGGVHVPGPVFVAGETQQQSDVTTATETTTTNTVTHNANAATDDDDNANAASEPHAAAATTTAAVEEGRLRAQAILQKFQSLQTTLWQQLLVVPPPQSSTSTSTTSNPTQAVQAVSSVYVRQRQIAARREAQRRLAAWHKNFAYLASAQPDQQQLEHAHQAEAAAHTRYQEIFQLRQQQKQHAQTSIHAGIGTTQRNKATARAQKSATLSAGPAFYVTGLFPSSTQQQQDDKLKHTEQTLRHLFGAFGVPVTRVHLYRDKQTHALKGDALVVLGPQATPDFVTTLCQQLNGAELEDGVVLQVQPAQSNSSSWSSYANSTTVAPSSTTALLPQSSSATTTVVDKDESGGAPDTNVSIHAKEDGPQEEEDEDLDAFFDSL